MMKGYLASEGVFTYERQLKTMLPSISPVWHQGWQQNSHERSNPAIYVVRYFGHKLHMDQNEKLMHCGVTYVLARDGYSGKIVGWAVMSRKNDAIIYNDVYRMCSMEYGLWDQLWVDHGHEFYLTLYIQKLRACRDDPNILPYNQITSTQNHIIERVWVEVNERVTYLIKRVISMMDVNRIINVDDSMHKLCHMCFKSAALLAWKEWFTLGTINS